MHFFSFISLGLTILLLYKNTFNQIWHFFSIRVFIIIGLEKYVENRNSGYHPLCGRHHPLCGRFFGREKNHTKDGGQYLAEINVDLF